MRHYHLTRNIYWRPIINVDKLWTLVPAAQKEGLTADSEVVPVINVLEHGYSKVLGNGMCVNYMARHLQNIILIGCVASPRCPLS